MWNNLFFLRATKHTDFQLTEFLMNSWCLSQAKYFTLSAAQWYFRVWSPQPESACNSHLSSSQDQHLELRYFLGQQTSLSSMADFLMIILIHLGTKSTTPSHSTFNFSLTEHKYYSCIGGSFRAVLVSPEMHMAVGELPTSRFYPPLSLSGSLSVNLVWDLLWLGLTTPMLPGLRLRPEPAPGPSQHTVTCMVAPHRSCEPIELVTRTSLFFPSFLTEQITLLPLGYLYNHDSHRLVIGD